ncbi:MAG: ferrochelatase, partial [candidate division Zixibacteria bacterium]|nr:ferrochelatase [candidate division Zixibacteria bacterium]
MAFEKENKIAVILLGMGGPNNITDVKEFLYNIFSDRNIIKLPGGTLFQKPFAKLISNLRTKKVQEHYSLIGGGSPLYSWTKSQADNIETELKNIYPNLKCFIGMRYFHPLIEDSVTKALNEGFRDFCFLPMYPQFSFGTTASSYVVVKKSLNKTKANQLLIYDFHNYPGYISLLKQYIENNISETDTLLFSAHSIPQTFVDDGDPYVEQTKTTAKLAAGDREYYLSFQSRTGPVKWVGPDTIEEVNRLLNETDRNLFIVPISFVCDHVETLYELDIELKNLVDEKNRSRIKRMPMFNDDPKF